MHLHYMSFVRIKLIKQNITLL